MRFAPPAPGAELQRQHRAGAHGLGCGGGGRTRQHLGLHHQPDAAVLQLLHAACKRQLQHATGLPLAKPVANGPGVAAKPSGLACAAPAPAGSAAPNADWACAQATGTRKVKVKLRSPSTALHHALLHQPVLQRGQGDAGLVCRCGQGGLRGAGHQGWWQITGGGRLACQLQDGIRQGRGPRLGADQLLRQGLGRRGLLQQVA